MDIKDHKKGDMLKKVINKLFETLKSSLTVLAKAHENSNTDDGRIKFDKEIANGIFYQLELYLLLTILSIFYS